MRINVNGALDPRPMKSCERCKTILDLHITLKWLYDIIIYDATIAIYVNINKQPNN